VAAAGSLDSMGTARSAALAPLRAAQELVKAGRLTEAEDHLRHALKFFRSVGATASSAKDRRCWPHRRNNDRSGLALRALIARTQLGLLHP
jgi:hypothetical protein